MAEGLVRSSHTKAKDSAKNQLQEWTLSRGISFPVYETVRQGPDHQPTFKARCLVAGKMYKPQLESREFFSKKDAEKAAALRAFECLSGLVNARPVKAVIPETLETKDSNKILIVDADNVDVSLDVVQRHPDVSFLLFVSRNGTKVLTRFEAFRNVKTFKTPAVGKDATDIYLTYETRAIRDKCSSANIGIYTKDHFAQTLALISGSTLICSGVELTDWLDINI